MEKATKLMLIKKIKQIADELHRVPKIKDVDKETMNLIVMEFGCWSNLLEAAGFKANRGRNIKGKYNKEKIIEVIQKKAKELNRVPKCKEITTVSKYIIESHFGCWSNALEAAGFKLNRKYNPNSKYLTDKQILDNIQSVAKKLGKTPRAEDVPYSNIAINRFGSWSNALIEAGLNIETKGKYTKEELIQILRDEYERLGHVPRSYEIRQNSSITRVFGSWENALLEADLKSERYKSDEELLEELIEFGNKIGRRPRKVDCDEHKFPIGKYQRRFGSWNNALKLAGFTTSRMKYTRQELVGQIQQVAKNLNKVPCPTDIPNNAIYYAYFKDWIEVIEAAGFSYYETLAGYDFHDKKTVTKRVYTKKGVIEEINSTAKKIKRVPLINDVAVTEGNLFKYFDTWFEVLEAANIFQLFNISTLYSQEQLISELINHAKKLNRNPKPKELTIERKWFEYQFGSWKRALLVAGLSPEADITFTKEKIIKTIQETAQNLKRIPKQSETGIHTHTYIRFFPTWEKVLEAACVNKKTEIISAIQEVNRKLGRVPRVREISVSHKTVRLYFGSWYNALEEAGLERTRGYSKKQLINMIKEYNQKTGKVPRVAELPVTNYPFVRQFGSYKKALEAAGFEPFSNYKSKEKEKKPKKQSVL